MITTDQSSDTMLFVANRLGYGIRAEHNQKLMNQGVSGWLDEQLSPNRAREDDLEDRIAKCFLRIKYDAQENKWPSCDEMRPLSSLSKPIEELWTLFDPQKASSPQERGRPRLEVIASTLLRSVYSRYQFFEVMTQFWHDHFHVNAYSDDHIAVALPSYDRDVIRAHCFGNFREMLEAVASSAAMQYYLSNHSSRSGAANENYARELFELHTLGRENYLNDRYDRWREVPGAIQGSPLGYIDQDVYEAARAFTGWSIEDGTQIDSGRKLPATGHFAYVENWHDGYQKRVLASEFDPFDKPLADGRRVLDLVAFHPATARHMSQKLCQRLVGSPVPKNLLDRVTEEWIKYSRSPKQISQILRVIAQSPEFFHSRGVKVKRPLAVMATYIRMMGYEFTPTEPLINQLSNAGQRLFGALTPAGLPDANDIFLSTNALRNRWQLLLGLSQNNWNTGFISASTTLANWGGRVSTGHEIVQNWFRLFAIPADTNLIQETTLAANLPPLSLPQGEEGEKHMALASAIIASAPQFQLS